MARNSQPEKPVESESEIGESEQNETQVKKASSKSVKSSGSKRQAEASKETTSKDKKRSKKKVDVQNQPSSSEAPKRGLFERTWSEAEEIIILQEMVDYSADKKSDHNANLEDFFDSIKEKLHMDATIVKLKDKIRKLKKKYLGHRRQELEGKSNNFSDAHQEKTYELSKKVWSEENENVPIAVRKNTRSQTKSVNGDLELLVSKVVGSGTAEEWISKIEGELFVGDKGGDAENEWKKLKIEAGELHLKKCELMCQQIRLALGVLKSNDH